MGGKGGKPTGKPNKGRALDAARVEAAKYKRALWEILHERPLLCMYTDSKVGDSPEWTCHRIAREALGIEAPRA